MTNTMNVPTAQQLVQYRTDEPGFLFDLGEVASHYRVLRVGRFRPGGLVSYAGAYVLRLVGAEYVTHLMIRRDDTDGPVSWAFSTGNYFQHDFARAVRDLNERS